VDRVRREKLLDERAPLRREKDAREAPVARIGAALYDSVTLGAVDEPREVPCGHEHPAAQRGEGLSVFTVEVREKKVYINGRPLDEPYAHYLQPTSTPSEFREVTSFDVRDRYGPVTVPPSQYFVMGDNRDNSQDSRYWGFLPREYIKGKALVIYWSYEAGREDYQDESAGATLKGLGSVFVHFFARTRWDRMFHQIR